MTRSRQIIMRLAVETRGQGLPEKQTDSQQKQRENDGVDRRQGEAQPACEVSSFRHNWFAR